MFRELIQELRDALRVVRVDAVSIGAGENAISDAARAKVDAALAKADAALAQPINHANYCTSYEAVSAEFAASKFASPAHRLDALIDTIVELRAALSAPARVPLTYERIELIAADGMRNAAGNICASCVVGFARAIEAAHGITEQKEQSNG
jgi:hypothetical protein